MGRQTEIEGFERPNGDKELDALAEAFKRSSKKRKKAQDGEIEARSALIEALKKKKLTVYEDKNSDPPLLVTLTAKDLVKVTFLEDDVADDEEDGDEEGGAKYAEMADQKASKKKPVLSEA